MPMNLNINRLGARPSSPSVSGGSLNQLLSMQGDTLSGLGSSIQDIGKTQRTQEVNDLIARGGLDGLNESQAQALLLGTAGGDLTKTGQAGMDTLLSGLRKTGEQDFMQGMQKDEQTFRQDTAKLLAQGRTKEAEDAVKARNKQTLTTFKGKDGKMYRTTIGGDTESTGVEYLLKDTVGSSKNAKDAISKLGLSNPAETKFRDISAGQRLQMLNPDGTMKPNVAWVTVPEKRFDGKITQKESGYFEDRDTGKRFVTSSRDAKTKKQKPTFTDKVYSLFD